MPQARRDPLGYDREAGQSLGKVRLVLATAGETTECGCGPVRASCVKLSRPRVWKSPGCSQSFPLCSAAECRRTTKRLTFRSERRILGAQWRRANEAIQLRLYVHWHRADTG